MNTQYEGIYGINPVRHGRVSDHENRGVRSAIIGINLHLLGRFIKMQTLIP